MALAANILMGLVFLIHVYIFLLETVLFRSRGRKVFRLSEQQAEMLAPAMSNQGCYNGFLAAGLVWGLLVQDRAVCLFFLACVVVAGLFGAATVKRSILYVQALPAIAAATAVHYL